MQEQQACDTFVSANSKQTIDYASSIYLANYPKYAEVTYVTAYYTQAVQKYSKQIGHANVINYFRYANEYNHAANRHKYSKYVCHICFQIQWVVQWASWWGLSGNKLHHGIQKMGTVDAIKLKYTSAWL